MPAARFRLLRYLLVAALFALGLMAKPMLVTLPFVLLLSGLLAAGAIRSSGCRRCKNRQRHSRLSLAMPLVVEKLPLLALAAVSCVVTPWAQREAVKSLELLPFSSRVANALVSYVAYLGQLFYPVGLAAFYPHPGSALPCGQLSARFCCWRAFPSAVLAWRRKCPYLLVGWLWYLGMLVPVIGLVQVGDQAQADRYTYLPQIGLYIALAWGVSHVSRRWPYRRWVCGVSFGVVLMP